MIDDEPRGPLFGGTIRGVPRHHWIQLYVGQVRHPGHRWMYRGIVRRDTFTVLGWGVILARMYRGIVRRDTFTVLGWGVILARMPRTYRPRPEVAS